MREGQPSTTATIVACARGASGVDPVARRLAPRAFARLAGPLPSRWERIFPVIASMRVRTLAIDAAIQGGALAGHGQLVILGAGLDARAWRLEALSQTLVYEIDHPATQRYKRARLGGLVPKARDVRFVSVDFEKDDLAAALEKAGHDKTAPTTWVWEGVTPYLTPPAMAATLEVVRARSCAGSTLALTYYTPIPSGGDSGRESARVLLRWSSRAFDLIGEPIRGLIGVPEMHELLRAKGFEVTSDATNDELAGEHRPGGLLFTIMNRVMNERILVATAVER
jgi:methyltransferase (TIGR00027 family)